MPAPILWGSELLLNTTTFDYQGESSVAALADGRFVTAWSDYSQSGADASFYGVRAQVFNADGSPSGAEFQVNGAYDDDQRSPSVTAFADGRFLVAWTDGSLVGSDKESYAVRAQMFYADGSKSGTEFQVNTTGVSAQWKVSLETLNDGRFVAVWDDYSQSDTDLSAYAIRGQLFNANGSKSGAEFQINTTVTADQTGANVTKLSGGGFVVAWSDFSQSADDPTHYAVRAQVFGADGARYGNEFLVNTTTVDYQGDPRLSALSDGGFVALWSDYSQSVDDISGYAVRAQRFDESGARLGGEFLVPSTTWGDQFDPDVVTLADGRFVVAWTDFSQTGADPDLYAARAQVFHADGSRDGDEFLLATNIAGDQHEISLAVLADGRLMASWTDSSGTGGDSSSAAVRGQIFDPREAPVVLTGTALSEQLVGTVWTDSIDGGGGSDTAIYQERAAAVQVTLNGSSIVDVRVGGVAEDLIRNIENIVGGSGNDTFIGDAQDNVFRGGGGRDGLDGGAGSDTADFTGMTGAIAATLNGGTVVTVYQNGVWEDRIKNIENVIGGSGNDTVIGDVQNNSFRGGAGRDAFDGGAGSDTADYSDMTGAIKVTLTGATTATLYQNSVWEDRIKNVENVIGGSGKDTLIGDGQNNSFRGGAGIDAMNGGAGIDTADYSDKSAAVVAALNGATAATVFVGGVGEDRIVNFENLIGGSGGDTLSGDSLANQFDGGAGNDTLNGALGNDTLTGGLGNDHFVFSTAVGAGNIDTITDFQLTLDKLLLDDDIFTALGVVGTAAGVTLTASKFQLGAAANDAGDRIIYSQATGQLFYDADGNGAAAQLQIALIGVDTHAALTAGDFLVVA